MHGASANYLMEENPLNRHTHFLGTDSIISTNIVECMNVISMIPEHSQLFHFLFS